MRIERTFPTHPDSIAAAREALEGLSPEMDDHAYRDARLLVSELVTNAIRHVPADEAGEIRLTLALSGDAVLHVEVSDDGPGIGEWAPDPEKPPEPHGWGLELLDRLSKRWGAKQGPPACVWFDLPARAPEPRGAR